MNLQDLQDMDHNIEDKDKISQLSHAVKHSIRRYLYELDGENPNNMYELVLKQNRAAII